MKKLLIITGIMLLSASALAFQFVTTGAGGKRITTTVNSLIVKGPAWSAAANYSSNTRYSHAVTYGGSTWAAIQNSNNQVPSDGSVYWWKYIAQGPTGPSGAAGATWHTGFDTPGGAGVTGSDGDLFFDTSVEAKVFKKTSGTWNLIGNIRGPQGIQGFRGYTGAVGPQGATGPAGAKGDTGTVTASAGLVVTQRQYSSHSLTMYPPAVNDPTGAHHVTWTVAPGNNRAGQVAYSSGKLLVDGAEVTGAGGGGGGTAFETKTRNVLTNMSSGKAYFANGFAKHTLPLAAGNQSVRVFANDTSAWISAKTESGVIKQYGGITTTAGFTARIPKGGVYEFISNAADSTWYAIKQAGSDLTQFIADFIAVLVNSPSPTYTFSNTNIGSTAYKNISTVNTGNAVASSFTHDITGTASRFRVHASTCGSSLNAGAACFSTIAFDSMSTASKSATYRTTAAGLGNYDVTVNGTGTSAGPTTETINPTAMVTPAWQGSNTLTNITDSNDATYIYAYTVDTAQMLTLATPSTCPTTINKLTLYARAYKGGSAAVADGGFRFDAYWASTHHYGSVHNFTTSVAEYSTDYTTGPSGGKWSNAEIGATSAFYVRTYTGGTYGSGTNEARITKIWAVVTCD